MRVVVVMRVGICGGGGVVLAMCHVWKCHSVKDREMVGRLLIMGTVTNWAWMIWPMVGGKVADQVGRKVADHFI